MACTLAEYPDLNTIPNVNSIYIAGFEGNTTEVLPSKEYFQETMTIAKNSVSRPAAYLDIFNNNSS